MLKLEQIKSDAAIPFKNRVVCDVCESRHLSQYGELVNWRGSTESEYFSIIFLKGLLTVSLEERESMVGQTAVNVCMSSVLSQMFDEAKGDVALMTKMATKYNHEELSKKDLNNISFTDVMVALNWRYADNAKIDYNPLTL